MDVTKEDTKLVGVNSTKGKGQESHGNLLTLWLLLRLERDHPEDPPHIACTMLGAINYHKNVGIR